MVVVRKLICDDGTVLYSRHNHDMVTHKDKNGKFYMLDGGPGIYYRTCGTGKVVEISTTTHSWEEIREEFRRFNRSSNYWVKLKDISNNWLENILSWYEDCKQTGTWYRVYLEEKIYRNEQEIYVPEETHEYFSSVTL